MFSALASRATLLVRVSWAACSYTSLATPRGAYKSPADLLKSFGRSAETKLQVEDWKQLQNVTGLELRKSGMAIKDRRYILWALEKVRQGEDPSEFAHEPKTKKKVRGWGPRVQNGKLIKSRRKRMRRN